MSDDITALLDRLVEPLDEETGDWNDVLERSAPSARRRSRRPLVLLAAAVAVAAIAALSVATPWRGGPTVVDRAAAAILAPASGQVLYERIILRPEGRIPTGAPFRTLVTPIRIWLDGSPPHRFRMHFVAPLAGRGPGEIGGLLGRTAGLTYVPAEGVLDPMLFFVPITESVLDPAAFVRAALLSGRAKADGRATIGGRETVRILVGTQPGGRGKPIARLFVDESTYRPVRIMIDADAHAFGRAPLPLMCTTPLLDYACLASPGPNHTWIYDFAEYRYLPGTAANRKLTNIRATHPDAEIV